MLTSSRIALRSILVPAISIECRSCSSKTRLRRAATIPPVSPSSRM